MHTFYNSKLFTLSYTINSKISVNFINHNSSEFFYMGAISGSYVRHHKWVYLAIASFTHEQILNRNEKDMYQSNRKKCDLLSASIYLWFFIVHGDEWHMISFLNADDKGLDVHKVE